MTIFEEACNVRSLFPSGCPCRVPWDPSSEILLSDVEANFSPLLSAQQSASYQVWSANKDDVIVVACYHCDAHIEGHNIVRTVNDGERFVSCTDLYCDGMTYLRCKKAQHGLEARHGVWEQVRCVCGRELIFGDENAGKERSFMKCECGREICAT